MKSTVFQQLTAYAEASVEGGLEYFQSQLSSSLKASMSVFKAGRLFSPQQVHAVKPDAATVRELLTSIPFLNTTTVIDGLKAELPTYLACANDVDSELCPLEWWQRNSGDLPHWSAAAKKMLLIRPSSASAERAFSLLNSTFGDQQDNSLLELGRRSKFNHRSFVQKTYRRFEPSNHTHFDQNAL